MTIQEAENILKSWQEFVEFADKLSKISMSLPESLLPYPITALEEAANIIAKMHFDSGDKETGEIVQNGVFGYLVFFKSDKEAIDGLRSKLNMMEESSELKAAILKNLKEAKISWEEHRRLNSQLK
ncbi:hypothetical protein JXR01_03615 [Candidatus Kaiserbacteria bacterium]|nr:MAG: hypothetical protein JXR01_03615 [Candidatus Kaiserbacteria bacterium]